MGLATVLLADDDSSFLQSRAELISQAGFNVITASNPLDAIRILETHPVDVAVLDLRLRDGHDEDRSGLDIAKNTARHIPKIILTAYDADKAMREALSMSPEGLPHAVDWIRKTDEPEVLILAIKKALTLASRFHLSLEAVSNQLDQDRRDALTQARLNYRAALVVAISGVIIIFIGAVLVLSDVVATGLASAVAGIVAEAVGFLFFKRVDAANERLDRYHAEGMQLRSLEILLEACAELAADLEQSCRSTVIEKAASRWFAYGSPEQGALPAEPQGLE